MLKKFASALVVVSLIVGGGLVLAPPVEANDPGVFFPFITTETGKFTFITLLNDGDAWNTPPPDPFYHFSYAMKPVPIVNTAGCEHLDGDVPTTPGDMMIFEVNGKVKTDPPSAVLFEGPLPDTSGPVVTFPVADRVGFLIVEASAGGITGTVHVNGTAAVVDTVSGLTFSYSTAQFNTDSFTGTDGNFLIESDDADTEFFLSWYPASIVTTSWYVLPLSFRSAMAPSGGGGLRVALTAHPNTLPSTTGSGAFDLDEHFFSGTKKAAVRCLGIITRGNLLQPATVASTDGGGWLKTVGTTTTLSPTDSVDPGGFYESIDFLIFKIQTTTALGGTKTTIHLEDAD